MVCYKVPFGFSDDILLFDAGYEVEPAVETIGSIIFSTIGESTSADPSKIPAPDTLDSSTVDREGFKTADVIVGLVPVAGLLPPEVSVLFSLAAL